MYCILLPEKYRGIWFDFPHGLTDNLELLGNVSDRLVSVENEKQIFGMSQWKESLTRIRTSVGKSR